jgi:hypothetical protein
MVQCCFIKLPFHQIPFELVMIHQASYPGAISSIM